MRKRVLMVGPFPPTVGGITSCIHSIMNSPLKNEYEFVPFTTGRPTVGVGKDSTDYSIIFKMNLRSLSKAVLVTFYHIISYPFILVAKAPTLVHIHTTDYLNFFESSFYLFAAKLLLKKTIIHIHATYFETFYNNSSVVVKALIRKILSMTDRLIVLSPNTQVFFEKISPSSKISVISNTTEIPSKLKEGMHLRKNDSTTVKVLFVGSEEAKRKGFFDVIKAIPIVAEKCGSNTLFIFAGIYDEEKQRVINEAKTLYNCVNYLGFLRKDEMLKARLKSDIYILPSYAEGLPVAMLEAMAAGLPVISTRVGSIPEVIEDGINGFLIEPGDYEALAEKIVELASDQDLRQTMGERNVEKIRKSYSSERAMQELNEIYREVICGNR